MKIYGRMYAISPSCRRHTEVSQTKFFRMAALAEPPFTEIIVSRILQQHEDRNAVEIVRARLDVYRALCVWACVFHASIFN